MRVNAAIAVASVVLAGTVALTAQRRDAFQESAAHPAIGYTVRPVHDAVAQMNDRIASGAARLSFDGPGGYLASLLKALSIPVESQMLVFSKTSAQAEKIDIRNPRAIYFNDDVAVGWVRGADSLEIASHDPEQGVIFYTLEQQATGTPTLKREVSECLMCHLTWDTLAVPGLTTISTFRMSDSPTAYASGVVMDQRTAIDQRWGGWFVTGTTVPRRHLGNAPVVVPAAQLAKPALPPPVLHTVTDRVDTTGFPTPYSDIVALMVFEHQAHMTNLLTHLNWEARVAQPGPSVPVRVTEAAQDLVDYMLFVDEAAIPARIEGSSGYAEKFAALGPADPQGRSLRQLDLTKRLMRYPCSYMIYDASFDALPPVAKDAAYRRLWEILSGQVRDKEYARLTLADRQAIVDILRATKKGLPDYFQPLTR